MFNAISKIFYATFYSCYMSYKINYKILIRFFLIHISFNSTVIGDPWEYIKTIFYPTLRYMTVYILRYYMKIQEYLRCRNYFNLNRMALLAIAQCL